MDLTGGALISTDGLVAVSSDPNPLFPSSLFSLQSEPSKQRGLFGSAFSKHGCRSLSNGGVEENDDLSRLKMAKGDPMFPATSKSAACLLTRSASHSLFPADGPQMLSFSSWKPDTVPLSDEWASPYFNHPSPFSSSSASPYLKRNTGLVGSGSSNLNINGVVAGIRGPFTHSQWFELEHQALIYKYIDAKMPIPSSLLVPIKRTFNPSVFPSSFTAGSYRTAGSLGWGPLHLGFSGSADPEPGRCRRTDGKKWRCSRDAVADQKYCERHMNRGRHRSRKRVEGHSGHAVKEALPAINSLQSASAVSSGGSSNNHSVARLQSKGLQPSFTDHSSVQLNRSLMNKGNTNELSQGLSMLTDLSSKSRYTLMHVSKQQNPFEETSAHVNSGLISTDSLLNSRGDYSSGNFSFIYSNPQATDQHAKPHPFRHFIDDWSKNPSNDRTELSISIPMASSDFSSSSSSPNPKDKMPFSPLRLSCEFNQLNDGRQRGSNWIPISWEPTIGGPLGEVLTNSTTPKDIGKNLSSSSLNLLTNGWNSSTRFESSPTDVLQKSGFGSLSSSARSSPRAENHGTRESDELLGAINPC